MRVQKILCCSSIFVKRQKRKKCVGSYKLQNRPIRRQIIHLAILSGKCIKTSIFFTMSEQSSSDILSKSIIESPANNQDSSLFPNSKAGKKPNYGTNNTLELLENIPSRVVEMKLDDVLTAVKDVDNLCDYAHCKTKTSLMGQNCDYCRKRFCFKHGIPEVHGCGDAAKKNERKQFLYPKLPKTVKQEEELEKAKNKLQAKLKDMQVGRMQKTDGGNYANCKIGSGAGSSKKKGK